MVGQTFTTTYFGKNKEQAYKFAKEDKNLIFMGLPASIVSIRKKHDRKVNVEWCKQPVNSYEVVYKKKDQKTAMMDYCVKDMAEAFEYARRDASSIWDGVKSEIISIKKTRLKVPYFVKGKKSIFLVTFKRPEMTKDLEEKMEKKKDPVCSVGKPFVCPKCGCTDVMIKRWTCECPMCSHKWRLRLE